MGSPSRSSSGIPSRITANFSRGATPSSTSSSRTSGLTAIRASETRASVRSTSRKKTVRVVPKYPLSTCPWNVCRTTGGRAFPASSAAARPIAPAFAVCVCRMCGRCSRTTSASLWIERASWRRDTSRSISGTLTTPTPRRCATKAIESSPRARLPATSVVWYPRVSRPAARLATWIAGPPMLRRAMTRRTRICSGTAPHVSRVRVTVTAGDCHRLATRTPGHSGGRAGGEYALRS